MHFTEDLFEQAVIELFENMGYTHIYAPDIERIIPALCWILSSWTVS